MYAVAQCESGGPDTLRYGRVDDPVAGPGQVRIAVEAAGVHLLDTVLRATPPGDRPAGIAAPPMILGREVAGTVESLGPDVDPRWRGARVVTHLGVACGGYAELAVRETEALHRIPDTVDAAEAVAMIGTGRTAMGIARLAGIQPDDVVLVTAAAGGIGGVLVPHARRLGATVVALAGGPRKVAAAEQLAEGVIAVDYRAEGWPERVTRALSGRGVTVVCDGVGGEAGRAAFDLLAPGGRIVLHGWSSGSATRFTSEDLYERGVSATVALGPSLFAVPGGQRGLELEALRELNEGRSSPPVRRYRLFEAAAAHRDLEDRATIGKVVLCP